MYRRSKSVRPKAATATMPTTEIKEKPISAETPLTPETQVVQVGSKKTIRKRRKKALQSNNIISQKVNVLVNNSNKKYINKKVLVA